MPLSVKSCQTAKLTLDPVLIEKANGLIDAQSKASIQISRPKHLNSTSTLKIYGMMNSSVAIDTDIFFNRLTLRLGENSSIRIGKGCTFNDVELAAFDGASIDIQDDCMFSSGIRVMTTDYHAIFDLSTGERINQPSNVVFENHVWVGRGVEVTKGSIIRSGSVIGARSLVAGEIPPNCIAVGVPARPIRNGVRWER